MLDAAPNSCWEREEREVFKNTRRHMCARKLAGLPRGNLKVAHRLSLVALATVYPEMDFLLRKSHAPVAVTATLEWSVARATYLRRS